MVQEEEEHRRSIHRSIPGANNRDALDGNYWNKIASHICPVVVGVMVVAEQAGVQMMKEYFEIEASKSTPQYGFRKGLKLFGDEGYQATKDEHYMLSWVLVLWIHWMTEK